MLASGATSYLVKDSDLEDIMHAVTRSVDGDALLADGVVQHVASELGSRLGTRARTRQRNDPTKAERISRVIDGRGGLEMAYQPIVELSSGRSSGSKRWPDSRTSRSGPPDDWFEEAAEIGFGNGAPGRRGGAALAALAGCRPISS